jgi:hypothetical protein
MFFSKLVIHVRLFFCFFMMIIKVLSFFILLGLLFTYNSDKITKYSLKFDYSTLDQKIVLSECKQIFITNYYCECRQIPALLSLIHDQLKIVIRLHHLFSAYRPTVPHPLKKRRSLTASALRTATRRVTTQKIAVLIYFSAEARNHGSR